MGRYFTWTPALCEQLRSLVATGQTAREIAPAFGLSRKAIIDAVRKHDLGPWRSLTGNNTTRVPADFAELWQTHSLLQLSFHYKCSLSTAASWAKLLGLVRPRGQHMATEAKMAKPAPAKKQPLRLIKPNAYATSPVDRPHRDASRAGMAAEFLRRLGPVVRCDARGQFDHKGNFWRRGSTVLDAAELIERAERLGWDAEAWKRVA